MLGLRFSVRGLFSICGKRGPPVIAVHGPLLLWSTGSRRAGSVVVAHGPSCSAVCGIFPDQGSNLCPLHWQADSQPLRHQGSPCDSALLIVGGGCGLAVGLPETWLLLGSCSCTHPQPVMSTTGQTHTGLPSRGKSSACGREHFFYGETGPKQRNQGRLNPSNSQVLL